jgi:taurine transport system ATP-binding protein
MSKAEISWRERDHLFAPKFRSALCQGGQWVVPLSRAVEQHAEGDDVRENYEDRIRDIRPSGYAPTEAKLGARLTVEHLGVTYHTRQGSTDALQDINFDVPAGGFITVIGPSGCGKTSLLNAIACFISPSSGQVLVDGKLVREPGPDRAVVHQQSAALLPWLNVQDNVGLALRARRLSKSQSREIVARYLNLVGLSDFSQHAIYEISGGMQQRVALARALAADSPIVLLDEPLGALDALQRQLMQDFLLEIWGKTKRTFFLITHSVQEATYLSTEVLVMSPRPGRIIERERLDFGERSLAGEGGRVKTTAEFVKAETSLLELLISATGTKKEVSR